MFHTSKKRTDKKLRRVNKRGQFTIFVILGLLVFMVFTFAIYARIKIASSALSQQADVQLKNYLTNNALNQYVSNCLDAVTYDIFVTASMQSGLFNISDKINNTDYFEYYNPEYNRTFYVPVAIDANYNCPDGRDNSSYIVSQIPGYYPINPNCPNTYVNNWPGVYLNDVGGCRNTCIRDSFRTYSGFFGVNNLSILCDSNGANSPNPYVHPGPLTCEYYTSYKKSFQKLLEEQITSDIGKCVNFTEILNKIPSNITNVGNVNATVQFNQGGFSVKLEYPFTILMRNKQPVTRLIDFGVTKDIPFKELYDYTYELANYDVKNATFELVRDGNTVISKGGSHRGANLYNPFYLLNITEGNISNGYTKLVQVIDTSHKIHGIPLMFNFYIRNRAPVLDYIHNGFSEKYDLVAVENRTITITPQGYDPDDEQLMNYTYGGWLEDQTDYYNVFDPLCSPPSNLDYVLANCTVKNDSGTPEHNWTKSDPFLLTGKNAGYTATALDLGLHFVTVTVTDSYGLTDFQIVRILVFDLPVAIVNGSNYYEDVDSTRASYEDLYLLNGAESTVGTMGEAMGTIINNFTWIDPDEPFNVTKTYNNAIISTKWLALPNDTNDTTPTIMTIKDYTFGQRDDDYTIHNITLTVMTNISLSDSTVFQVNVTKCLNHSNPANHPYPYNDFPDQLGDALNADHTCCTDAMTYELQDTECYRETMYGMRDSFVDYGTTLPDTPDYTPNYDNNGFPDPDAENDIFEQTFVAHCSGDRGNTCTGRIEDNRLDLVQCPDDNGISDPAFNQERCSGPAQRGPSDTPIDCVPITGGTFETYYQGSTSGGICTTGAQCSDGFEFSAYNTGIIPRYSCDGRCGIDGKCNSPTNCKCSSDCGSADVSPLCNGAGIGGYEPTNGPSCSGGNNRFSDVCSNCGLIDNASNRTCRGNEYASDCYSPSECSNRQSSSYIGNGNTEYCTFNCDYINCANTGYKVNIVTGGCFDTCTQANAAIHCDTAAGYSCCITAPCSGGPPGHCYR